MWKRGHYVYRTKRHPATGKPYKEYLGAGSIAERMAQINEEWEAMLKHERDTLFYLAKFDVLDVRDRVDTYVNRAELLAVGAMIGTGHYLNKRVWRRKKGGDMATTAIQEITKPNRPRSIDEAESILARAKEGDESVLPQLKELLKHPRALEILRPQSCLRRMIIGFGFHDNLSPATAFEQELPAIRAELLGERPTAVERSLAEVIITQRLYCEALQYRFLRIMPEDYRVRLFYEKSLTEANKRLLASMKTLATVRKLAVPVLQVNVARTQQIVGNATTSPTPKPRRRARKTIAAEPTQTPAPAIGQAPKEETKCST